jgi:IS30 family transposase
MTNRPQSGRLNRADRTVETRRLRAQGLTHREIAERLDVSVSTVANDLRSSPDSASGAGRSASTERHESTQRTNGAAATLLGPARTAVRAVKRRLP